MTFPANMEEAEAILTNVQRIRKAKSQLENDIYTRLKRFEIETGFAVTDLDVIDGMGGVQGVKVEVRV
jgi:hypothetical protein